MRRGIIYYTSFIKYYNNIIVYVVRRKVRKTVIRWGECLQSLHIRDRHVRAWLRQRFAAETQLVVKRTPDIIYHLSIMLYAISSPIPRPQRPVRVRNRTSSTSLAAIGPRTLSCTSTRVSSSHFALSCAMRQLRLAYSPKGALSLGLRRGTLRSFPVGFDDPVTPP